MEKRVQLQEVLGGLNRRDLLNESVWVREKGEPKMATRLLA